MGQIQQRLLTALLLIAAAPSLGQARKFYDDDPLLQEPKPKTVANPEERQISDVYDFMYHTLSKQPPQGPSLGVNTLGEVPDGPWYTNRHGTKRMSTAELTRGPGNSRPPDPSGKWRIISAKTDGVTTGFVIEDTKGVRYVLKFDAARYPELASAADVIGSKFFYAFGYNTPENYIVRFKRDQLVFDAGANFSMHGRQGPLTRHRLDEMLRGQPVDDQGRFRAMASRIIDGKALGQFRYYGTRSDDPNDIVPHERRRDLRGLFVFCAWLNHDDSRDINTLDSLVEDGGIRYVKHYLIDFGAILGSNTYRPDSPRNGFEYLWEPKPAALRFLTLGLALPRWSRSVHYPSLPAVGRFESKLFDPDRWKPEYRNIAFSSRTPGDEFWAAKRVMAFSDDEIRTMVKIGEYSDPRAADWITKCLIERRDKVGRAYFAKVLPLNDFRVEGGRLQFTDLAEKHGFHARREYTTKWSIFDNDREQHTALPGGFGQQAPEEVRRSRSGYFAATISGDDGKQTVIVYLRKRGDAIQVVGVERTW